MFESRDSQRPGLFKVPSSAGSTPSLTYEGYYGLKEKPFSLSADPRFLFKSPSHAPAFDRLLAGIRRREGLIVLTGEIGTGKTTLCRAVLGSLDRRTFSTFVPDPFVSREDLLTMLLVDFGVMSIDDLKSGRLKGASRPELSYPLYEFLNSLVPLQAYAVLVIDEAQNLPLPLLEEIRILSDLEGREKLLQVVLIGQPELRAHLKLPELRQVDQRVSVRCELAPLGRDDVTGYVSCRLNVAAGGTSTVQFTPEALDAVYQASGGTPRLVNLICDRALQHGYERRASSIDAESVRNAIDVLDPPKAPSEPVAVVEQPASERPGERLSAPTEESEALSAFASEASPHRAAARQSGGMALASWILFVLLAATVGAGGWYLAAESDLLARDVVPPSAPASPRLATAPAFAVQAPAPSEPPASAPARASTPAGRYVIQVASFESDRRAARLVEQLAGAGYRAYHVPFNLGDQGRGFQVVIGGYATLADAESALAEIREIPGYDDANIARSSSR